MSKAKLMVKALRGELGPEMPVGKLYRGPESWGFIEPEVLPDGAPGGGRLSFPRVNARPPVYEAHFLNPDGTKSVYGDGLEGMGTVREFIRERYGK